MVWHEHCEQGGLEAGVAERLKQCSILFINANGKRVNHRAELERIGFSVHETQEWPPDDLFLAAEVVIVLLSRLHNAPMIAARIRAKPHFGRRVLITVVPPATSPEDRRCAVAGGFDDVLFDSADSRTLIARILRSLRSRPEHRCFLPGRDRTAA